MVMMVPCFFGYGSLVNRRTHGYRILGPARVQGWRRAWRRSPLRERCYLTVVPCETGMIEGLIAELPDADWQALDAREQAYDRVALGSQIRPQDPARDVSIYAISEDRHFSPTKKNPILLSYIDVVVQGYLTEFGPDSAQHFFDTTDGWHAPVVDDRSNPIYVRAQTTSAQERAFVDQALARVKQGLR